MEKVYTIYKITNTINNKCYIGYTSKKNPRDRFGEHISASKGSNFHRQNLHEAIRKYGGKNFTFEILYQDSRKEHTFRKKEQELIEEHNAMGPSGYNMAKGGGGAGEISEETRKKMSNAAKGRTPWNKGIKGSIPWNKGLTKEDERVRKNVEKAVETRKQNGGWVPWNKGLTKEDDRVRKNVEKAVKTRNENGGWVPWNKGRKKS